MTRTLLLSLPQFPISNQVVCAVLLCYPALRPRLLSSWVNPFPANFIKLLFLSSDFNDLPEGFVVVFLGYKLSFRIRGTKQKTFIVRHDGELVCILLTFARYSINIQLTYCTMYIDCTQTKVRTIDYVTVDLFKCHALPILVLQWSFWGVLYR